jgi:hypothetical protein
MLWKDAPHDIITIVIEMLKDSTSLVKTCKQWNSTGKVYGYVRIAKFNQFDDPIDFVQKCIHHRRTITTIQT